MRIIRSTDAPAGVPTQSQGLLVASIDVEWTKNYRIKNGNKPFCYSVVWVTLPWRTRATHLSGCRFEYTSVYTDSDHDSERTGLVNRVDEDLHTVLDHADLMVGHQLCSDLAVLAANGNGDLGGVQSARDMWRNRRLDNRIIDTRFDVDHLLEGRSRRLVDVCEELGLGVAQPELGRKSMTALHRDWLSGDHQARERISVLNIRHSLSAVLIALRATGTATWRQPINVNRSLAEGLTGTFDWIQHPVFTDLL